MRAVGRLAAAIAIVPLAGCGGSSASSSISTSAAPAGLALSSPAFSAGRPIPRQYTCDGQNLSPPLSWSGIPHGAQELLLEMQDRDAPDPSAPGGEWVHWIVTGIPPTTAGLEQGRLPAGAHPGRNSFGSLGYRGPCPPRGAGTHHYVITLVALGSVQGRAYRPKLASGTLVGTYARR